MGPLGVCSDSQWWRAPGGTSNRISIELFLSAVLLLVGLVEKRL